MFTPRVSPIHRNLATSYVLVDALLDDLCLGGFSGIVEISLRDADYRIVIGRGQVSAIADNSGDDYGSTLIADLASRGRKERGLISIYRCSDESAWALTGRIKSKTLYNRLSTEFADLEKMISKLQRETDREWFVEIETDAGLSGLVYINQTGVHSIASSTEAPEGEGAFARILEQCRGAGGTFSVYYRMPGEQAQVDVASPPAERLEALKVQAKQVEAEHGEPQQVEVEVAKAAAQSAENEAPPPTRQLAPELIAEYFATAAAESAPRMRTATGTPTIESEPPSHDSNAMTAIETDWASTGPDSSEKQLLEQQAAARAHAAQGLAVGGADAHKATDPGDASTIVAIEFDDAGAEAEAMPEVKRLMAEVASTIEKTAREIEPRDTFSIYLRAGQLKIADRYPFLDPFGSEFEYHAGEIAFIGKEGPSEFVRGLTEALQLAVRSVVEASSQPERLRGRIQENLQEMTERLRTELEGFGLEKSINQITS